MENWRQVKSGTEWGLFYGIVSWLLATGISNDIPAIGIWTVIISRTLMGFLTTSVKLEVKWWMKGLIWGVVVNLFIFLLSRISSEGLIGRICFAWSIGFWMMIATGVIFGILIGITIGYRETHPLEEK